MDLSSSSDGDDDDVPEGYDFPSFIIFCLWGPYVDPDKRLNIDLIDDSNKAKRKNNLKASPQNIHWRPCLKEMVISLYLIL